MYDSNKDQVRTSWRILLPGFILVGVCYAAVLVLPTLYASVREEELKPRALPPLYPAAQQVNEGITEVPGDAGSPSTITMRVVSFNTEDEPDKVLDYYISRMNKAGWSHWNTAKESPGRAYFSYSPDDGPTYKFVVSTDASATAVTHVRVEVYALGIIWTGEQAAR